MIGLSPSEDILPTSYKMNHLDDKRTGVKVRDDFASELENYTAFCSDRLLFITFQQLIEPTI